MRNGRNAGIWAAAIVLLALLVWGLQQVVVAPLQTGDVYPHYSSLRSDPMGAKALFESLAEMPGLTVERLYKPRITMLNTDAAILVLGADPWSWKRVSGKTV